MKCKYCFKDYKHLGSHLWHRHQILAREYKEEFGLPYNYALINREIKEKKRIKFFANPKRSLENLRKDGKKYQFKRRHNGHRRISEKERRIIIARIKKVVRRHKNFVSCPVCKVKYRHLESHLYNKHRLTKVK